VVEPDWQPPALPRRLTDPVRPVLVGALAWLVALVVLLVAGGPGPWVWACVVGVGLGGIGLSVLALQRRANARGSKGAQKL
jgi:Flp pilus assembly protein TadB